MTLLDTSEERTLDRNNCKNCTIMSIDIFKGVNFFLKVPNYLCGIFIFYLQHNYHLSTAISICRANGYFAKCKTFSFLKASLNIRRKYKQCCQNLPWNSGGNSHGNVATPQVVQGDSGSQDCTQNLKQTLTHIYDLETFSLLLIYAFNLCLPHFLSHYIYIHILYTYSSKMHLWVCFSA